MAGYTSFTAEGFRGLTSVTLSDLARVNLVVGRNNVGKTSLLEALFLHSAGFNPAHSLTLARLRGFSSFKVNLGQSDEKAWEGMFPGLDTSKVISFQSIESNGRIRQTRLQAAPQAGALVIPTDSVFAGAGRTVRLRMDWEDNHTQPGSSLLLLDADSVRVEPPPPPPPVNCFYAKTAGRNEVQAERYTSLRSSSRKSLLEALKLIEPDLQGVEPGVVGGETMLHMDLGLDRTIPLPLAGDGLTQLVTQLLGIASYPGGVVLFDEVDSGLYTRTLPDTWRALLDASTREDVQVFATTHSIECVVAAYQAFRAAGSEELRVHRLERRDDGPLHVETYTMEELGSTIESGWDVR